MTGAAWFAIKPGLEIQESLRSESAAWRRWIREAKRLDEAGRSAWAIRSLIGVEPDRWIRPGGVEGGRAWLPRYAPGSTWDRSSAVAPPAETIAFEGSLRPYQAQAVEAWRASGGVGILVVPCGGGKTVIACRIIGSCPTPALVLVHTTDLQEQWIQRIRQYLPSADVGWVGGGRVERPGRVVVGMVQTLSRYAPERLDAWGQGFGLVVIDELHHAPAETWSWVLAHLWGRYRLGLTATPDRADGLGPWMAWSCGPIRARVDQEELQACGAVLAPRIRRIQTGWDLPEGLDRWDRIMAALCSDETRNGIIQREILGQVEAGRVVLALTGRVHHAVSLAESVGGIALVGEVSAKKRREGLDAVRAGTCRVVVATQLADEGLDLPEVDTVALCYPEKDPAHVEQRVGRALRPAPGKVPEVLDFRDAWKPLMGWARRRDTLYRKKGWY